VGAHVNEDPAMTITGIRKYTTLIKYNFLFKLLNITKTPTRLGINCTFRDTKHEKKRRNLLA
jgi:hypothetical protein